MRQPWLCLVIVGCIATPVLSCSVAACLGKQVPENVSEMAKYALGALASFLVNVPRGSIGGGDPATAAAAVIVNERKVA